MFLIFQFLQNIHHNNPVYFIRVDSKFLYFLLLVLNSSFSIGCFLLMKFVSNLLFIDIDFCKLKVIQSLDLHSNLYLLILFKGVQVSNNILILSKYILVENKRIKFSRPYFDKFLSHYIYCLRYCQTYWELSQIEAHDKK